MGGKGNEGKGREGSTKGGIGRVRGGNGSQCREGK